MVWKGKRHDFPVWLTGGVEPCGAQRSELTGREAAREDVAATSRRVQATAIRSEAPLAPRRIQVLVGRPYALHRSALRNRHAPAK